MTWLSFRDAALCMGCKQIDLRVCIGWAFFELGEDENPFPLADYRRLHQSACNALFQLP